MIDILECIKKSLVSTKNEILFIVLLVTLIVWFCSQAKVSYSCGERELKCFTSKEEALDHWKIDNARNQAFSEVQNFSTPYLENWCYERRTLGGCCSSICFPFYRFPA